jgi:hypothetical protein
MEYQLRMHGKSDWHPSAKLGTCICVYSYNMHASSPVSATVAVPRLRVCPAITGRRLLKLRYYHEKQLSPERLFEVRDVTVTCATPLPPTHRESAPALATSSAGAWMYMRGHEPAPPAHFSRIDRSGASTHASTAPPSFPGRGCRASSTPSAAAAAVALPEAAAVDWPRVLRHVD